MPLIMKKTEQVMSGDLEPPPHCQGIPPASMMGRSLSKIVCSLHYQTTLDVWATVQPTHAVLDLVGWAEKEDTFFDRNCRNDYLCKIQMRRKLGMQCFLCMILNLDFDIPCPCMTSSFETYYMKLHWKSPLQKENPHKMYKGLKNL